MVGYPESITDPSYLGKILVQTYPLIGNYGVDPASFESDRPQIAGYAVSEACENPSHVSSRKTLDAWLLENGIPGIAGIDTRALAKKLRVHGVMPGILAAGDKPADAAALFKELQSLPDPNDRDYVSEVSPREVRIVNPDGRKTVVLIDCGAKENIVRSLVRRGARVVRVPADTGFERIRSFAPAGIVVSNGPGDPKRCTAAIRTVQDLMRAKTPIFGICLGQQLLGLALGGKTFKLKFGHRGANHPVKNLRTGKVEITSQNHGFCVDLDSIKDHDIEITHMNLNDGTLEGMRHRKLPLFSVQYHPEASPGPHDADYLFAEFIEMMEQRSDRGK